MKRLSIPGSETGTETGTPVIKYSPPVEGSELAAESGSPELIFGPPTAGFELRVESTAALQRWEKPGYPAVYFFSKGFSAFGRSVTFPTNHSPGPEFVEVKPAGKLLEMGQFPPGRIFVRRDDPLLSLAEVMP